MRRKCPVSTEKTIGAKSSLKQNSQQKLDLNIELSSSILLKLLSKVSLAKEFAQEKQNIDHSAFSHCWKSQKKFDFSAKFPLVVINVSPSSLDFIL